MKRFKFTPLQISVHIASLVPFALLIWDAFNNNLTVNPIQEATFRTGRTALTFLILSLAATPINTLLGIREVLKFRRTLGLYTFFYASIHFLIFVGLDYGFNMDFIYEAIFEKRFALVGFTAFLTLLPLAITSTKGWKRRLKINWTKLHKLSYLAVTLVIIHFTWLVKSDLSRPLTYGAIAATLLVARIPAIRNRLSGLGFSVFIRKIRKPKITQNSQNIIPQFEE